ncbi:GTPase LSG1-2 [Magnolia sinica]|uniref:GTPase LSG1-2 n=1 Tax=Magnolia sinica TaxID=86752 RepID=UPI002658EF85|nr:GTPase LSG1-2 [Magnolia sinica]
MGKNEKSGGGLGRALVKHHNQMVQQSKEKGRFYNKQHKRILESVTEVGDIEAVVEQSEEADLIYSSENPLPNLLRINLDTSSATSDLSPEETRDQQKREEALHAGSLQVPRRPPWNAKMTVEELDANERQAFLFWRRSLARLEENEKLVLTPFEKNLDIWRQLWRVLERSDLLVMVVDGRDPLFYRCPDLEAYACEINEHKRTLLLLNKADLLPFEVRQRWANYFRLHGILFLFWSAKAAAAALEGKKLSSPWAQDSSVTNADTKIYGRDELLARLQTEAEAIVASRALVHKSKGPAHSPNHGTGSPSSKHVVVGFVGYPNVGKSSTINALVGEKRTGVTSTPGKTKHFQTLIVSDELVLCDCPGLVFPSFSSSRYEMIASGVLPIDRMTEHREAVQVVANRVTRHVLEAVYNIRLPKPKPYESQSRPPLAAELLRAYCLSRGHVGSSGLPDETRAARQILKDYIDGKLPHFEMPPGMSEDGDGEVDGQDVHDSLENTGESDSDVEDLSSSGGAVSGIASGPDLSHVMNDLDSFDTANGLPSTASGVGAKKMKPAAASHKHHRKPQRKKDRSWRVSNDGGDGMPVARVFQKEVTAGPIKAS